MPSAFRRSLPLASAQPLLLAVVGKIRFSPGDKIAVGEVLRLQPLSLKLAFGGFDRALLS
jgi:hypothetical protein